MFNCCYSLISLPDISKLNTSKVEEKYYVFYESFNILNGNETFCRELTQNFVFEVNYY